MSAVVIAMSMSLDGYIAHTDDNPGILHEWMFGVGASDPGGGLSGPDKALLDELRDTSGALIAGRRLYDITHGWGGSLRSAGFRYSWSRTTPRRRYRKDRLPSRLSPVLRTPSSTRCAPRAARTSMS
jgi:hypothetical protein